MNDHDVPDGDNDAYVRSVHDRGFAFDLGTITRRRMMTLVGGAGAAALTGAAGVAVFGTSTAEAASGCATEIETETNGPYPADGTNGLDVRTESGIVRTDIRSSFGSTTDTAPGVPLSITFVISDLDCSPLAGAAVYVWHCNRDGNYSMYSTGITDQNYLRGIAETDDDGSVTFTSIFPACYSGRWPHIHFEVYESVAAATSGSGAIIKTSQIAMPEAACKTVFATDGYSASVTNLSQITLATDNVFGDDDAAREVGTVTGSVADGFAVSLAATVDPSASETPSASASGAPSGTPSGTPPTGAPPTGTPTAAPTSGTPTATATPTATVTPTAPAKPTAPPKKPKAKKHKKHKKVHRPPWWPWH